MHDTRIERWAHTLVHYCLYVKEFVFGACFLNDPDPVARWWDMVCDLRRSGEVWVDDILFLKNGRIVIER